MRFVSRFSRERVRTASVPARPHVQTGPRQWGYPPTPLLSNLAPGATFGAAAVPRGLTSRELTVPSKGRRPQEEIHSDTLLCSIFATTLPFCQKIFFVQKWPIWRQLARCQRLCPRSGQNWGNAAPPPQEPPKCHLLGQIFGDGGRERGCCGDKPCENRGASRPICAQEEQLKPYGTVRRAIFAIPCARTVAAAFP